MSGGQKFIARNRAPRVQIEYDVELYGAEKKVQLPFVMGVVSDLSGKSETPPVADRKFLEIDVDNFDERMAAIAPKAQFSVPNTLTGEGNLSVDLTFTKMRDFTPEAIAEKVDGLKPLLDARRQLSDLMTYMDGKAGAETLIEKLLTEPALLAAISGTVQSSTDVDAALDSLRGALPATPDVPDTSDDTLAALAAQAPADQPEDTSVADALGTLQPPPDTPDVDDHADALDALRAAPVPDDTDEGQASDDVLDGITRIDPSQEADTDATADVLSSIDRVTDDPQNDTSGDVLAGIARVEEAEPVDTTADILGTLQAPPESEVPDDTTDQVLGGIVPVDAPEEVDSTPDVLSDLANTAADLTEATDDTADILASIEQVADAVDTDQTDDILARLDAPTADPEERDNIADVLGDIAAQPVPQPDDADDTADILAGIEQVADAADTDQTDDILARLDAPTADPEELDNIADVLGDIAAQPVPQPDEEDDTADILAGIEAPVVDESIDSLDDILGDIEAPAPSEDEDGGSADAVLAGLEATTEAPVDDDDLDDILGTLDAPADDDDADSADDILASIDTAAPDAVEEDSLDDILGDIETVEAAPETDAADDILASLETPPTPDAEDIDLDDLLGDIAAEPAAAPEEDSTDDILAGLDAPATVPEDKDEEDEDLDDILGSLGVAEPTQEEARDLDDILGDIDTSPTTDAASDDLDDILSGLDQTDDGPSEDSANDVLAGLDAAQPAEDPSDDLDDILGTLDAPQEQETDLDLANILGDLDTSDEEEPTDDRLRSDDPEDDDLDALLGSLGADDADGATEEDTALDDLLAGLALSDDADGEDSPEPTDTGPDDLDDLDDILSGLDADTPDDAAEPSEAAPQSPAQSPFGLISAPRPDRGSLNRGKFRIAMFGDFTGRAARGLMETGDALAARRPIPLDVDTIDEVIEGFATTLTLKIGKDGAGVEVKLKELDDLHPDELYDNIEIFEEISGLRQQLGMGSMADRAITQLQTWSQDYGTPIKLPKRSASTSVPTNLKLSDFQALIGDTGGALTQAGAADDLIAQIVGPHIVKAPDAGAAEMTKAVDEALSSAMRLVLHHPDFQAIEAQWRSLDMLARRIETDSTLEIILYDVSAEELAADLAAQEDLSDSGLFKLVTDVLDPEDGAGGFSALFGLYTFEETPPHAELLARIGQVGAHVDAPFFSAITPGYLDVAKEDRHPLVAQSWDLLRSLPEAAYLALSSPRFLLRLPYGAKSEPIYPFAFEEFTAQEGLKGMLWCNPIVLVAILLAGTFKKDGKAMDLGSLMSLGDLPFHYVTDRHGDQVALPCTERNLTSDAAQTTIGRGLMPVVWVKGRNEIRLGSFRSLGGDIIAGPWEAEVPAPRPMPSAGAATLEMDIAPDAEDGDADASLDDLLAGLDDDSGGAADDDTDASLDDLLAGFDEDTSDDSDGDDMDPELAALLEGL